MEWVKCGEFEDLPVGQWLVRLDDERKPYQVAYVSENNSGHKIVIVGNYFSWDAKPLIEYAPIN